MIITTDPAGIQHDTLTPYRRWPGSRAPCVLTYYYYYTLPESTKAYFKKYMDRYIQASCCEKRSPLKFSDGVRLGETCRC